MTTRAELKTQETPDERAAQAYRDYIDALQNGEEERAVQKCREWLDLQLERAA